MTGNEGDIVTQREQLLAYAGNQFLMIAARKVRATNRALEQHIPNPGHFLLLVEKHHVTRRVTRAVKNS